MVARSEEAKAKARETSRRWREENRERHRASSKAYDLANRERVVARRKAWREANAEQLRALKADSYNQNREVVIAATKAWREANPDKVRAWSRKRWVENETYREQQRAWRTANLEKVSACEKRYKRENPHVGTAARHRRRARMLAAGPGITSAEWLEVLAEFDHRCAYCHKHFDALELEHMVPLARGGSNARRNVVPACGDCNRQKGVLNAFEFLSKPRSLVS